MFNSAPLEHEQVGESCSRLLDHHTLTIQAGAVEPSEPQASRVVCDQDVLVLTIRRLGRDLEEGHSPVRGEVGVQMEVSFDLAVPYDALRDLRVEGSGRRRDPQAPIPLVDLGFREPVCVDVCQKRAGMPIGPCHLEQSCSQFGWRNQVNAGRHVFVGLEHRLPNRSFTDEPGDRGAFEEFATGADVVDPGNEIDGLYPLLSTPNGSGHFHRPAEMTMKVPTRARPPIHRPEMTGSTPSRAPIGASPPIALRSPDQHPSEPRRPPPRWLRADRRWCRS